jgi:hypothetical protein
MVGKVQLEKVTVTTVNADRNNPSAVAMAHKPAMHMRFNEEHRHCIRIGFGDLRKIASQRSPQV